MIRHLVILILLGAGLWACSDVNTITASSESVNVNTSIHENTSIDSLIAPYRDELSASMDIVIAFAPKDYVKARPNSALNNWAADVILDYELDRDTMINRSPTICLLNVGGLRNSINQGNVTVGDIYKLMPFDNEVVWVEMPWSSISLITEYLIHKGGEPIANAVLNKDTLLFNGVQAPDETFWVVTSDYLMNGGDKMDFFEEKVRYHYGQGLMRDIMLEGAKLQDTLDYDKEERIKL